MAAVYSSYVKLGIGITKVTDTKTQINWIFSEVVKM